MEVICGLGSTLRDQSLRANRASGVHRVCSIHRGLGYIVFLSCRALGNKQSLQNLTWGVDCSGVGRST